MTKEEWENSVQWVGIVAGCLIEKDGKYLLVQEKQKKVYGLWNLPAGRVDKNEEINKAAVRETKEESGYDVELIKQIGLFHEDNTTPIKHVFSATIIGGELAAQEDEILDVKWHTFAEIKKLKNNDKLRAPWIWQVISENHDDTHSRY